MGFFRRSFFVFILLAFLMGAVCPRRARASADRAGADNWALESPVRDQPVSVGYLSDTADAALPDDPGAGQQATAPAQPPAAQSGSSIEGRQTKRILWVVPNFRAVSADQHLPPQSVKEKLKTATLDSLDYSSLIFVAGQAGVNQWTNSYPEFRQGAAGYGRYYWHTFADATDENLWVEFIYPTILREDTRYYTLGKGGFPKRLGYSVSRVFITRTDSGHDTVNASEIMGAGTAAGISNLYYPGQERTFTKTYQRWITNLAIDCVVFSVKEFWPDVNNKFFHQTD
jgi:hypothetical protein